MKIHPEKFDVSVGWISKGTHGSCDLQTGKIRLNPESMIVEVFIHEVMHLLHPLLNREEDGDVINELTARVYHKLTAKQIRAIARKLVKK